MTGPRTAPAERARVLLAAGTVGGAGTRSALAAAIRDLGVRPIDLVVTLPPELAHQQLPGNATSLVASRTTNLLRELLAVGGRSSAGADVYIGFADRLPFVGRGARTQVMVVQNPHLYGPTAGWSIGRRVKLSLLRAWACRSAAIADLVVCSTESSRADVLRETCANPASVVVRPIPVPAPQVSAGPLRKHVEAVLTIGDVYPYKRLDVVADAVAGFASAVGRSVRLEHLGDPIDSQAEHAFSAACDRATASGVVVERRGRVSPREVEESLANADVVMLGSEVESQGLPLAEAMAIGVPVLCRALPAFLDQAGESVRTVPVHASAADFTRALVELDAPAERRSLATMAAERVVIGDGWCLLPENFGDPITSPNP